MKRSLRGLVRRWRARRDRTLLRTQLLLTVVVLAAVTVLVTSVVAATVLRGYLMDRTDDQLIQSARQFSVQPRIPPVDDTGPRPFRPPADYYAVVFDDAGTELWTGNSMLDDSGPELPRMDAETVARLGGEPFTVDSADGDGSWRVIALPQESIGSVAVGLPLDGMEATTTQLLVIDGVVALLALAALAGLAWWTVRNRLRPLEEVEETAEAIAAGDLSRRVPPRDPRTEVGRLSVSLNAMLSQIEAAFEARRVSERDARASEQRMRRFIADASHELRTPLTSIRGFAELYRQGVARDEAGLRRLIRRVEDEAARMGLLVDDLLLLARLDQQPVIARAPVDLVQIVVEAVLDARVLARRHDLRMHVDARVVPPVVGDAVRLRQVVDNLVRNATVHTPPGTTVDVSVGGSEDGWAVVEVRDDGPGLSEDDAAHVFERFYRADPSRSRADGTRDSGSGLGLAIVAALVAAHGGRVELASALGRGATFRVLLPPQDPTVAPSGPSRAITALTSPESSS
ncbi:sensor histidine kinase [Jiangella asiatica]|uniref:histidine kinase n=1 Tax=Jiangella asiatica TaxID=2530372 RepID=A0A4R5DGE4_9ACTN|nr:HAMP domain-containing sensor histidine kinase [Jiangella asiatica]TDE10981.1 HAMP domain-containing histidine kinase [Jiangella asiatica]